MNTRLLESMLRRNGFATLTAHARPPARELAALHPVDLILLDVMMPKLSGFEVCKRIRTDPSTRHIAVLMVTALDQSSDVERAVEVGTHDFLTKPINKIDLQNRIHAILSNRTGDELLDTLSYLETVQKGGT
jgi:DNA-binding response OmpR family regulator